MSKLNLTGSSEALDGYTEEAEPIYSDALVDVPDDPTPNHQESQTPSIFTRHAQVNTSQLVRSTTGSAASQYSPVCVSIGIQVDLAYSKCTEC